MAGGRDAAKYANLFASESAPTPGVALARCCGVRKGDEWSVSCIMTIFTFVVLAHEALFIITYRGDYRGVSFYERLYESMDDTSLDALHGMVSMCSFIFNIQWCWRKDNFKKCHMFTRRWTLIFLDVCIFLVSEFAYIAKIHYTLSLMSAGLYLVTCVMLFTLDADRKSDEWCKIMSWKTVCYCLWVVMYNWGANGVVIFTTLSCIAVFFYKTKSKDWRIFVLAIGIMLAVAMCIFDVQPLLQVKSRKYIPDMDSNEKTGNRRHKRTTPPTPPPPPVVEKKKQEKSKNYEDTCWAWYHLYRPKTCPIPKEEDGILHTLVELQQDASDAISETSDKLQEFMRVDVPNFFIKLRFHWFAERQREDVTQSNGVQPMRSVTTEQARQPVNQDHAIVTVNQPRQPWHQHQQSDSGSGIWQGAYKTVTAWNVRFQEAIFSLSGRDVDRNPNFTVTSA